MVIHKQSLFLVSLFLASASLSLAYSSGDPIKQLDQCLEQCQDTEHMLQCEGRCAHEYYTQRRQYEEDELVSVSPQREFQQCQQLCERKRSGQRHCLEGCEKRFRERQDDEFGEDVNPPRKCQQQCKWEPRSQREQCLRRCVTEMEDVNRPDPPQKCQQQCAEVVTGRGQQERCQRQCVSCQQECMETGHQDQQQCSTMCQREVESEFGSEYVNRPDSPRKCQQQCAEVATGRGQQERCQRRCVSCQQECLETGHLDQQQCSTMCQREVESEFGSEDVNRPDPPRKCQQQCAEVATGRGQQERCQRRCVSCQQECLETEHQDQQQCSTMCRREVEREFGSEDVNRPDPPRKCQQQCAEVVTDRGQQERCQRRCVSCQQECLETGHQDQQQCSTMCRREVEHEFGSEDVNRPDPPRKCQRECQGEPRRQQGQCLRRCVREMEEERFEPEEELQECKSRCQRKERGYQQQQQCQKRCERQREFQRPSQRYESCQRRCQGQRDQPRRMRQCMERCDQEFRGRGRSQPLASILDFMGIF